jgi:hypothetical protein
MRLIGSLPSGKKSLFADNGFSVVGNRIVVSAHQDRAYTAFALELTEAEKVNLIEALGGRLDRTPSSR